MEEQRKAYGYYDDLFEENLTMEENPITITITIDNYNGQTQTFTMDEDTSIDIIRGLSFRGPIDDHKLILDHLLIKVASPNEILEDKK
jgi:hypothetical protein